MRIHRMYALAVVAVMVATGPTVAQSDPPAAASASPPISDLAPTTGARASQETPPGARASQETTAPVASGAPAAAVPSTVGIPSSLLPKNLSVGAMFHNADIVVQAVLVGLVVASLVTWTFLLGKGVTVLMARRSVARAVADTETERSMAALQLRMRGLPVGLVQRAMTDAAAAEMALSGSHDAAGIKERAASRLQRLEAAAGRQMARGTGLLATIGSTAPFVGLFGTVWGIMNSFIGISQSQTTNLAVVAPGIAEALLATATGLVAAIPAVVIYNLFARAITGYRASLADLSASILRLVSRELGRRGEHRNTVAAAE